MSTNSSNLVYRLKTAAYETIVEHLNRCSDLFVPPLYSYVNIEDYAKKIHDNAVTFECWEGLHLVGLVAAYFNNDTRIGFITNVSVLRDYQGYGLASTLIRAVIDYAKENGFSEIDLEVNPMNKKAGQLYGRHGFVVVEQKGNQSVMKVKLKMTDAESDPKVGIVFPLRNKSSIF